MTLHRASLVVALDDILNYIAFLRHVNQLNAPLWKDRGRTVTSNVLELGQRKECVSVLCS